MVCPKCGRVLLEGEICVCSQDAIQQRNIELMIEEQQRQEEANRIQAEKDAKNAEMKAKASKFANDAKNITADISTNIIQDILTILKKPKEGIKEFVEESNVVSASILIGLQSIIIGILAACAFSSSLFGSIAILFGGVNKFLVWLLITLTAGVGAIGNAAGFMLVSKLQKHSLNFIQSLCLSASKAVVGAPLSLVSIILMAINGGLGFGCFILALIAGVCFDSISFNLINKDVEKEPYYLIFIELINIIATFVMLMISTKIIF